MSFNQVGIEIEFKGKNEQEEGYVTKNDGPYSIKCGQVVVAVDPKYYRPTEVELLIGDPTKANKKLGWTPKYNLNSLVKEMVEYDVNLFKNKK
jgi:GDPmannose 4,6-dehydratase